MDYKAPAAKADRLKRKAARKEARADRQEARGKAGKAAKTRAKAAVKTAKAGAKEAKSAAKAGRQAARQDRKAARVEKRQGKKAERQAKKGKAGDAVKAAAKKAASAAKGKASTVAKDKIAKGKMLKSKAKAKAGAVKGKISAAKSEAKNKAKAKAGKIVGKAKKVAVALAGPSMKHGKGPHKEGIGDDLKRAAKSVKAGFEYGAKSLKDDAKASYKKYIKPGVDAVVDAKNKTFGKNFFGDNVVDGIKGDAKSVKKALSMESASEKRKADLKDNPVVDRSKEAMNKGDAPMMSRLHKSGGLYKAPSMGKIQYGGYERPEVKMGTGGKGLPMMGSSISKHMAHNKGGKKK